MPGLAAGSPLLKKTQNFHINTFAKDKFTVTPNQTFEKGLEQLIKDLRRILLLNWAKPDQEVLPSLSNLRNDPQFDLFVRCYNQTLLSFFCDVINAAIIEKGFMVTGQAYRANLETETLSLKIENDFLLIGKPASNEQYFIPGNITVNFKLGASGIEFVDIKFSNTVLQDIALKNGVKISSDLTFMAKMQESAENLYRSYRALVLFLNKPTVDYHALGGLPFLQKTIDDFDRFIKANPELAKKLSTDKEFMIALKSLDPIELLAREIKTIMHPTLQMAHLRLLNEFLNKGIKIDNTSLLQVKDFVAALNQEINLDYKSYLKLCDHHLKIPLKLEKENFPDLIQKKPAIAASSPRKPLGEIKAARPISLRV